MIDCIDQSDLFQILDLSVTTSNNKTVYLLMIQVYDSN